MKIPSFKPLLGLFLLIAPILSGCHGAPPPGVNPHPACVESTTFNLSGTKKVSTSIDIIVYDRTLTASVYSNSIPLNNDTTWAFSITVPSQATYIALIYQRDVNGDSKFPAIVEVTVNDHTPPQIVPYQIPGEGTIDIPYIVAPFQVIDPGLGAVLFSIPVDSSVVVNTTTSVPAERLTALDKALNSISIGATVNLQDGLNQIQVTAHDKCGNTGSEMIPVTYVPVDQALNSTERANRLRWIDENSRFFTEEQGIDPATGFPVDVLGDNAHPVARWSQPTSIGFYVHILGNVIAKRIALTDISHEEAQNELGTTLDQLIAFQGQYGFGGLIPWVKLAGNPWDCPNGFPCPDSAQVGLIDNANLTHHLASLIGLLEKSNLYLDGRYGYLRDNALAFIDAQGTGYHAYPDPFTGALRATYNVNTQAFDVYADRFGSEVRASVPFLIEYYDIPVGAWNHMQRSTSTDPASSVGPLNKTFSGFDGGAFQYFWPLLSAPEETLPKISTALQNALTMFEAHAEQHNLAGFPSAASLPEGGYGVHIGLDYLKEFPDPVDETLGSIYALASAYVLDPSAILARMADAENDFPGLIGPLGFYDSMREGGAVSHNYYAVDQGALVVGLIGTGGRDFKYFMESRGMWDEFEAYYTNLTLDLDEDADTANFLPFRYDYDQIQADMTAVDIGGGVIEYTPSSPGGWAGGFVTPAAGTAELDTIVFEAKSNGPSATVRFDAKLFERFLVIKDVPLTDTWKTFRYKLQNRLIPDDVNFIAFTNATGAFQVRNMRLSDRPLSDS